jgi:hypothetical protein
LNGDGYRLPGYVDSLYIIRNVTSAWDSLKNEVGINDSSAVQFTYGDSVSYKFIPYIYAQGKIDSVFYYLGGESHVWPSDLLWQRVLIPKRPDMRNAMVFMKRKVEEIADSLLYWMIPDSLIIEVEEPERGFLEQLEQGSGESSLE